MRRLGEYDFKDIFELCKENTLYYEHCPPMVTEDSVRDDMVELPKNTDLSQKYYIGFYDDDKLIAVMDLIDGYPQEDIVFIGFFITKKAMQKQGIGMKIITEVCECLTEREFHYVRLAWVKGNPQAEHFWIKNGFVPIKETSSNSAPCVILAEKTLQKR